MAALPNPEALALAPIAEDAALLAALSEPRATLELPEALLLKPIAAA